MQVPFVDLKTQYATLSAELDPAIAAVIADTAVIAPDPVDARSRESVTPKYGPDQETIQQYLRRIERNVEKRGEEFDKEWYENRFKNSDADKDGILTREERRAQLGKEKN